MTEPPFIHPNCPRRLARAYKNAIGKDGKGYNMRALAEECGVNINYVSRAVRLGERPSNPAIAKALFFPRLHKHRDPRLPKPQEPEHIKWWRRLDRDLRNEIIKEAQRSHT